MMRAKIRSLLPLSVSAQDELRGYLFDCLKRFPDIAEGVITLDGIEQFFTYKTDEDDVVEVCVAPRTLAEKVLNEHGLTTDEPFLPPLIVHGDEEPTVQ